MAGWREGAAAPPRLSPPPPHPQRHCHRRQRCCHRHQSHYCPHHCVLWKFVLPVVNITSTILIRTSPPASWSPRAHWPSFSRTAMCTQNVHSHCDVHSNSQSPTHCSLTRHTHSHHCIIGGSFQEFSSLPGQGNVPGNDLTHAFTQTEANFERVLRVGVGQVRTWSSQSQSHLSQQLFAISLTCATKLLREVLHSHWRSPPLFPLPTLQKSFSAAHSVQLDRAAHLDQLGRNSDTMPAARYEDLSNLLLATFDFANLLLCKKGTFKLKTLLKGEVNPIFFIPPLGQNWAN